METFRDFLVWYNDLDISPFVKAVERFQQFYFQKGIDVFKSAISVQGIARQLLFGARSKIKMLVLHFATKTMPICSTPLNITL